MKTILSLVFCTNALFAADFSAPVLFGNSSNGAPFMLSSLRYQQVSGADRFSSLTPVGGGWITALQFRREGGSFIPGFTSGYLQISFSTTARPVDGLSTTFSENVGIDQQTVYNGPVDFEIGAFSGPLGNANPYIVLTTPFFYNPAAGNLLMDIQMFGAPSPDIFNPVTFDASDLSTDLGSRVYSSFGEPVGIADTTSLITGFRITPVPEPSTIALLVTGLGITLLSRSRKNQPNNRKE